MAASTDFPSYNYQMSGQGFGGGSQLYGSSPYATEVNIFIASFEPRSSVEAAWSVGALETSANARAGLGRVHRLI